MFPPQRYDSAGNVFRLQCPFCKAESPLWFLPEEIDRPDGKTAWEVWLETPCRECGQVPRTAAP